ncbi:MAG: response regulator [Bdellovibrionaceae bacterium]|nr:response regulator [Pseudobdellovibrionaceae bacterium]
MNTHQIAPILIVEDDADVATVLKQSLLLWMDGVEVEFAKSYPDAIQALRKRRYSLIVSDYNLGEDGSGIDIWKKSKTPFLMISGMSKEEVFPSGAAQAPHFLQKPFSPSQFVRAIAKALAIQEQASARAG